MPAGPVAGTMLGMSDASLDLTRRALIEVASAQLASPKDPVLRRYRLARVPIYSRSAPALDRFAHLRRSYD